MWTYTETGFSDRNIALVFYELGEGEIKDILYILLSELVPGEHVLSILSVRG